MENQNKAFEIIHKYNGEKKGPIFDSAKDAYAWANKHLSFRWHQAGYAVVEK